MSVLLPGSSVTNHTAAPFTCAAGLLLLSAVCPASTVGEFHVTTGGDSGLCWGWDLARAARRGAPRPAYRLWSARQPVERIGPPAQRPSADRRRPGGRL